MTTEWSPEQDSQTSASLLDNGDELKAFRDAFVFPETKSGEAPLYFAGHSLGLMPKMTKDYVTQELEAWGHYAVEGHFKGKHPWLPYHENLTSSLAKLVGAKETEVVAMNSLTTNLHLLLVSFYRPTKSRYKILIENNAFPSDKYAVDSQAKFHGFNPADAIVELRPRAGEITLHKEDIEEQIAQLGDSLALVLIGNCNYLSGQYFSIEKIVTAAHKVGAYAGLNLAHGAGNLHLHLHNQNVDFAVWCSYKYLNSGPGGIAGAFIHENHLHNNKLPRFEGWWGHNKATRFKMGANFDPIPTAEAWQLSNPPILQLASLRASMQIFNEASIDRLRRKGDKLTSYLDWLIRKNLPDQIEILTPQYPERGSMLCLKFKKNPKACAAQLLEKGVYVDYREPDIIRITPAPLYNSFSDVYKLIQMLKELVL